MHLEKYTKSQCVRMCNHYERTPGDGVRRINENIKPELTHKNYNLAGVGNEGEMLGYVHMKRILEGNDVFIYGGGRPDMNTMCDVVLTAPKTLPQDREKEFFQHAYNFLVNRYGIEGGRNVVSSWVHMDETTPHMHFAFVPLAAAAERQQKKGFRYKLCAKAVATLQDLRTLHTDMQKYMDDKMGKGVAQVITGGTEVNKPMYEYKRQKLMEDIAQVEKALAVLSQDEPKSLNVIHYPAYEKGTFGMAKEKTDSWTVAQKDVKELVKQVNQLKKTVSGLKKLDQLSKVLHGDIEKELAQEQDKNRKLEQDLANRVQQEREFQGLEQLFKVALKELEQTRPALAKAIKVSTANGYDVTMKNVQEHYDEYRKTTPRNASYSR